MDELYRLRIDDLHFADDLPAVMRRIEDRKRGVSEVFDCRLRRKDGSVLWARISASPLFEEGQFVGILRMFTDISDRKLAELELVRHAEALARSNADLNQFAYVASHDLQEPLRVISSYAELLAKRYGGQFDADADEFLGYLVSAAGRMSHLIEDLLQYSRVARAAAQPRDPLPLGEAIQSALLNLGLLIDEKQAVVTVDEPLPVIEADRTQMTQLFQNLISNGIKYSGGAQPRIHIRGELTEDDLIVSVSDNGIGIADEYRQRIFGMFKRLHGRDVPGTGIGLALCRRIVENHGGRIWVESAPGAGSTFYFALPAAAVTERHSVSTAR